MKRVLQKVFVLLFAILAGSGNTNGQTVTIGALSGSSSYLYGPYYRSSATSTFNWSKYAYLYTNLELGIPAGSMITQIEWYKVGGNLTGNNTFNILLDNTSATSLTSGTTWNALTATATPVYSSTTQSFSAAANSWEALPLTGTFVYNGGNLLVLTDHIKSGTASAANNYIYNAAANMAIGTASGTALTGTSALTTASYGNNRPTIRITYVPGTPCAGPPNIPIATASVTDACVNQNFTLNATNPTLASGVIYQWQSSPIGLANFTDISGGNALSYIVSGQASPTDYRIKVTCSNTNDIVYSNIVAVGQNPMYNCYCTPISNCVNEGIENVSFSTINNSSLFCVNPNGYTDYGSLGSLATVVQSQVVNMSVTAHINSSPASAGVWIDYDQSGTFDASEYTSLGSVSVTIPSGGTTNIFTGNVTIAANALTGITRMRVRSANQGGITNTSSCLTTGGFGEFEDYLITINTGTICTGTPSAGSITGPSSVCPNVAFTLNATGFTTGFTGFNYLWEVWNSATSTWDPAPGTNNGPTYTATGGISVATDYRFVITCTNGNNSSTSASYPIALNSFNVCYCNPSGNTTYGVNNFSTTGGSVNISNLGSGTSPGGYGNYTAQALVAAPTDVIGFTASYVGSGNTYGFAIFIDYNQNGLFSDAGELVFNTTAYATSASGSFTIPAAVTPGSTRIRIVANYLSSNPSTQYCATGISGEFEDYTLTIGAPPTCLAPSVTATTGITTSSADINWNPSLSNPSLGYDYYYSSTNTPPTLGTTPTGSVSNTTTTVNLPGLNGSTTYYFWVRANCGGNDYSSWAGGSFMTLLTNDLPSGAVLIAPNAGCVTYSNVGGSFTTGEPPVSCRGTSITTGALVWFKFDAPLSGFVKVSTDGAGTALDTKVGVFSTSNPTNPADLTAYSILGCDDDNGITYGTASTVFVSGLTPGVTYYVAVDHYNGTATGSFCVRVDDVTTAMISPAGACLQSTETPFSREDYTGWATIIDAQGRLIANAKRLVPTGSSTVYQYTGRLNVNTGGVRQAGTDYYLDRNFSFAYGQAAPATTFDVRLYFLDAELAALQAVDPNATLANLNVTHQTGTTCAANYTVAGGTNTVLMQTANGSANSVSWIQVNTPGFSNFYIMSGIFPLRIDLTSINATNIGSSNRVDWTTASELAGDRFELERSTDGEHFINIANLNAKGSAATYSYIDERALTGINYYRIKLVDAAGSFAYSNVVNATVKSGISFNVEVYPNPVSDKVHVRSNGAKAANASVQLLDVTGRAVKTVSMTGSTIEIDMAQLPSGIYMIKYIDDAHSQSQKVTKQ
jgi:hypothetical protein